MKMPPAKQKAIINGTTYSSSILRVVISRLLFLTTVPTPAVVTGYRQMFDGVPRRRASVGGCGQVFVVKPHGQRPLVPKNTKALKVASASYNGSSGDRPECGALFRVREGAEVFL
jgi:hypothetical protein